VLASACSECFRAAAGIARGLVLFHSLRAILSGSMPMPFHHRASLPER
jgi:hypothetical protein